MSTRRTHDTEESTDDDSNTLSYLPKRLAEADSAEEALEEWRTDGGAD